MLIKVKVFYFKDRDRPNFKYVPFGKIIINDKYVI